MKDGKLSEKEKKLYKATLEVENQRLKNELGKLNAQYAELKAMVRDLSYSYGERKGVKSITIEFEEKGKNDNKGGS